MNSAADLGGSIGHGPVVTEIEEPTFHAEWEKRVLALVLAMGATGTWNLDMSRSAREDRPPAEYLAMSYYEIWLAALERLLVQHDLVTSTELASGDVLLPPRELRWRPTAADIAAVLSRGAPTQRPAVTAARFDCGDAVTTASAIPVGHTRLPGYARGKRGAVTAVHGCHVFPDANANGQGEQPQWLYTVEFSGPELFGSRADPRSVVSIDAFEPYLAPA